MKRMTSMLLALVAAMAACFAQAKPVVVIVPFDARNVSQDDVDVISDVFLSEYTSTGKATVVDRSSFDKIKSQHRFEASDWSNTEKVAELGKALNANQIITGQISQFGSQLVCTVRLVDVNTTEIVSSTVKRVANMDALFEECARLSQEIAAKASLSVNDYQIGSKGPGGGIVFAIEGDWRWEVSENLGEYDFSDADKLKNTYEPNGFFEWYVPSVDEMQLVYDNLVKTGTISASGSFWTSTKRYSSIWDDRWFVSFNNGAVDSDTTSTKHSVRLVRKFNVNNVIPPKDEVVGIYTTKIPITSLNYNNGAGSQLYTGRGRLHEKMQTVDGSLPTTIKINDDGTYAVSYYECNFKYQVVVEKFTKYSSDWKVLYINIVGKFDCPLIEETGKWERYRDRYDGTVKYIFTRDSSSAQYSINYYAASPRLYFATFYSNCEIEYLDKNGYKNTTANVTRSNLTGYGETYLTKQEQNDVAVSYTIGDRGPGGGAIFHVAGNRYYECSELSGVADWETAKAMCRAYNGGGYMDWYLPTKDELNYIYQNLRKTGKISGNDWYWAASPMDNEYAWSQRFRDGHQDGHLYELDSIIHVLAVRSFTN